jgi:hypothetical protein
MVSWLRHRLHIMETHAEPLLTDSHVIGVLMYPRPMAEAAPEGGRTEQPRCDCPPACPGKCLEAVSPKKAPSAEAWAARAPAYDGQRRAGRA